MPILERLPTYVGRESQKALLRETVRSIVEHSEPCAIYLEAAGGLGKSRLIELLPHILQGDAPKVPAPLAKIRIARLIDLYDFDNHDPNVIEQQLISGLKQSYGEWYHLPPAYIDGIFRRYLESTRDYVGISETDHIADTMRQLFITCWNRLSAEYPLVMCFDTVETLFTNDAPQDAQIMAGLSATGADLVLDWIRRVLPNLRHTLALFSGRPVKNGNPLSQLLEHLGLLHGGVQTLERFTQIDAVRTYLNAYRLDIDENILPHLLTITEGRPLLLTCYAETCRPKEGIPPPLPSPTDVADRPAFEDWLIDILLNPVRQTLGARQQGTLGYCLYFLVYARRGVTHAQLEMLFRRVALPYDPEVIAQLGQVALVKTVNGLLYLHDEIFAMIDASGQPDVLGLRQPTLNYLCDITYERVHGATYSVEQSNDLVPAMFDHLYYELVRDIHRGYRFYTVYCDRLLRNRVRNKVLVLSDVFWSTTSHLQEALAQQHDLTNTQMRYDEQVRRVKLLRSLDQNTEAFELAEELAETFEHEDALAKDPYLLVDFSLTRANALIQAHPVNYEARAEQLLRTAIELLQQPQEFTDNLLSLRRSYFLGSAYVSLGYLRNQQQAFHQAMEEEEHARSAFKQFRDEKLPEYNRSAQEMLNDYIDTDLAQVTNNLAYNLARSGNLKRALRLSNELINDYAPTASDYRKALFYNTNALIHMWRNEFLEAIKPQQQAEQAAENSGINRAQGLVAQARGLIEREMMRARGAPSPEIADFFQLAVDKLAGEPSSLRDVFHDWARFARDLARLYRSAGQIEKATVAEQEALGYIDKALGVLPPGPSMQRADLLESKALIYRHLGRIALASALLDEAEAMMDLPMTDYGQVVSAKIALQRAFIMLDTGDDLPRVMQLFAVALTRAYIFGKQHRDQGTFERLIEEWLSHIDEHTLQTLRKIMMTDQFRIGVDDLPYQQPVPDRWEHEWAFTLRFLNEIIDTQLEI